MTYAISEDKKRLTLTASRKERAELDGVPPVFFGSSVHEAEVLEDLLANSCLNWIYPEECGDLTDAPILGFRDEEGNATGERWGFMDYQVRSFCEDLRDKGATVFIAP